MSASWYVRSARPSDARPGHVVVTGDVLHLAGRGVWPLCGGPSTVLEWALTGPECDGWERHKHFPLCARCARDLTRLFGEAGEQLDRHADHLDRHTPAGGTERDTS